LEKDRFMQTDQSFFVQQDGARAVLRLTENLTASNAPELRVELKSLVAQGMRELVVDLADVRVVDSTGIGLLVAAHNSLSHLGGKLSVINANPDLLSLFTTFRLNKHFDITGSGGIGKG
jgi:anti-anti-sigma factor